MDAIIYVILALVSIVIGTVIGITYRKKIAEKEIGSAEKEAVRILNDAIKVAESKKREALVEAKEEIHKLRSEVDKESKERRSEVAKQERRLIQKEESLDKKTLVVENKTEELSKKIASAEKISAEAEQVKSAQLEMLERISGLSKEEARQNLISSIEEAAKFEAAVKLKAIKEQMKEEADTHARELIARSIQRCAADHVAETTVSVVPLPNDEMKGRIIGREGRNIRTLETLTGVELIIDDTPEAITLSAFEPVRREIARVTLEKLISDGRIHPTRIEEMFEKAKKEVDQVIKSEGEKAIFEVGIPNIHPDLIKILGRMKYRTSYGQNVLKHSIEVALISGILASELGVDITMAKRAGLLHDLGKAIDHEVEGSHVAIGVDIARKYKEKEEIIHAIEAHHGDVEARTVLACIVQAADAISAARPGARRENVEAYIKRLERLEEIANTAKGVERSFAIQAGREIRVIVKSEEVSEEAMILLSREIANNIESELEYPGQIKVQLIRETRAVDYAK